MFTRKAFLTGLAAAVALFLAAPAQAAESTLQEILTRGEIIIGTDIPYEPFEFLDDEGNFVGFEIDLAKVMAKELGVKLTFKKAGSFDTIRAELNNGDFDLVLSGMTRTLQRAREVNFTDGYYDAAQIAMVSKKRTLGGSVMSYAELNAADAVISVQSGTTGEGAAKEFFPKAQINPFPSTPLAVQEVIDGRADAVIMDDANIIPTFQQLGSSDVALCCPIVTEAGSIPEVHSKISRLTSEYYGMAVRFGDEDLLHWLNLFIEQTKTTIVVTDAAAETYELEGDAIGQPILSALRAKWGL